MERRLIVMRHAKSSWANPAQTDHDRPLNDRGRRATPLVARRLGELGWQPQHILSSDSRRTHETAALLLAQWEDGVGAEFRSGLYLGTSDDLEKELVGVSEEVETLLVLGHNPGWEGIVYRLTGESVTMKTATAALLHASCDDWANTFQTEWVLEEVIHPRELG